MKIPEAIPGFLLEFGMESVRIGKEVVCVDDQTIIDLYWKRSQRAITETSRKYGAYCRTVAAGILADRRDAEECLTDTWLAAWNAIPPQRPRILSAFLGRITRNLALNRWLAANAEKRGGGQITLALEELGDCVSGSQGPDEALAEQELIGAIRAFLTTLPEKRREVFLRRYWLVQPVHRIALEYGMLPGTVSMWLTRIRRELKEYLTERGFEP